MRLWRMPAAALVVALVAGAKASPGADALRTGFGETLEELEAWDVSAARKTAEALLLRYGHGSVTDELLGRVRFFEGDYAGAADILGGGPSDFARLAKNGVAEMRNTREVESAHFRLRVPDGEDQILVPYALDTLERAWQAIGDDLKEHPPEKIRVEILRDAGALSRMSPLTDGQIHESGTIALCKFAKLMVVSPDALVTGYPWQDTLAHELTHYLIVRRNGNTVPVWLHEGIAKFEESRWRGSPGQSLAPTAAACLAQRVRQRRLVTFARISPSMALLSGEDATVAFAEVFDAIRYLFDERGGVSALDGVLDRLRAGETDERAIAEVAGESFPRFQAAWKEYLRRQPLPAGIPPVCRGNLEFKDRPKDEKPEGSQEFGIPIDDPVVRNAAHLGALLQARGRVAAAAYEYARAESAIGARSPLLSNDYALALLHASRDADAESLLQASLRPFPEVAQTHLHLGEVYLAEQRWARARDELLRANAIDPFDPRVHAGLAQADLQLSDPAGRARELAALAQLTGERR